MGWHFHEASGREKQDAARHQLFCWLRNFFFLLLLVIGFSRNYFGVHTPQDVVVGMALGLFSLFIGRKIWNWQGQGHANAILAGGLLFSLLVGAYISLKGYPMDYLDGKLLVNPANMVLDGWFNIGAFIGFLVGWTVERRWIRFVVPTAWPARLCCFLLGGAGLLLVLTALSGCLYLSLGDQWGTLAAAGVQIFYSIAFYPWLWKQLTRGRAL